jgi:hypothetical protein
MIRTVRLSSLAPSACEPWSPRDQGALGGGQEITAATSLSLYGRFPVNAVEQCFSRSSRGRISSNEAHRDAYCPGSCKV